MKIVRFRIKIRNTKFIQACYNWKTQKYKNKEVKKEKKLGIIKYTFKSVERCQYYKLSSKEWKVSINAFNEKFLCIMLALRVIVIEVHIN